MSASADTGVDAAAGLRQRYLRFDRWDLAFVVAMVVVFGWLTWLGRSMDFFHDDWRIIALYPNWSVEALMEPFNGHWILTANTIWQALFSTVGLSSYTPYLVPLHLAHIFTAAAVYWGVRRIAGPAAGLAAGSIILVNRGAAEMIYQGHAVEAVSSTMFGAWALVLTLAGGRGRLIAAAILMTLAVASHTTSLPFIVAIGVYLVFVPGRPRQLWVVVPALVAYATWYLMWGRWDGNSVRIALHVGWFRDVLEFVRDGVSFAMGALSGTGAEVGIVLITVLVLATLWQLLGDGGLLKRSVFV